MTWDYRELMKKLIPAVLSAVIPLLQTHTVDRWSWAAALLGAFAVALGVDTYTFANQPKKEDGE
jgi:hypothetical protein